MINKVKMVILPLLAALIVSGCDKKGSDEKNEDKVDKSITLSVSGNDNYHDENGVSVLSVSTSNDSLIDSYSWVQVAGPELSMSGENSQSVTINFPNVDRDETAQVRILVTDINGVSFDRNISLLIRDLVSSTVPPVEPPVVEPPVVPVGSQFIAVMDDTIKNSPVVVRKFITSEIIYNTNTSDVGLFDVPDSVFVEDNELYLISINEREKMAISLNNDEDNESDVSPILSAVVKGKNIKNGGNISILTDVLYKYIKNHKGRISPEDIELRLNEVALILTDEDMNNDGKIDFEDVKNISTQSKSDLDKLGFHYKEVNNSDLGMSLMDAYKSKSNSDINGAIDRLLGDKARVNENISSKNSKIKIELIVLGEGAVYSNDGMISFDLDSSLTDSSEFYEKSLDEIVLTANVRAGTIIKKWNGCDSISLNGDSCTVNKSSNKKIEVIFGYNEVIVDDNFVDLSNSKTEFNGQGNLILSVSKDDLSLKNNISKISSGTFVTGLANNGFIKKVSQIREISDNTYEIIAENAQIQELVEKGTLSLSRSLTNADLDVDLSSSSGSISISRISNNVTLKKPKDLNSNVFNIEIKKPSMLSGASYMSPKSLAIVVEGANGSKAKLNGEIDLKIDLDFDMSTNWFSLQYLKVVPNVSIDSKLELEAIQDIQLFDPEKAKKKIFSLPFKPVAGMIGPVPVYLKIDVDVFVGAEGKLTGSMKVSNINKFTARTGMVYNKGVGVNYIADVVNESSTEKTEIAGSGEIAGYISTEPMFLLYGVTGPRIEAKISNKSTIKVLPARNNEIDWKKNQQCFGGFHLTNQIEGEINLDWVVGYGDNYSNVLDLLDVVKINGKAGLYKNSYTFYDEKINSNCNHVRVPVLSVVGGNMNKIGIAERQRTLSHRVKVFNNGNTDLDWEAKWIEDGTIDVSPRMGSVKPGYFAYVKIIRESVPGFYGYYRNKIDFNNVTPGIDFKKYPGGEGSVDVSIEYYASEIESPKNVDLKMFSTGVAKLTWDYPDSIPSKEHVKYFRVEKRVSDNPITYEFVKNISVDKEYVAYIPGYEPASLNSINVKVTAVGKHDESRSVNDYAYMPEGTATLTFDYDATQWQSQYDNNWKQLEQVYPKGRYSNIVVISKSGGVIDANSSNIPGISISRNHQELSGQEILTIDDVDSVEDVIIYIRHGGHLMLGKVPDFQARLHAARKRTNGQNLMGHSTGIPNNKRDTPWRYLARFVIIDGKFYSASNAIIPGGEIFIYDNNLPRPN